VRVTLELLLRQTFKALNIPVANDINPVSGREVLKEAIQLRLGATSTAQLASRITIAEAFIKGFEAQAVTLFGVALRVTGLDDLISKACERVSDLFGASGLAELEPMAVLKAPLGGSFTF